VIGRLLVANRGEIARRIFATCRACAIETVAVYSDADAHAPFVGEADEAVALGGTTPATSYLRGERIVEAALGTGADAIHPGYGFLSESAGFAQAVLDAGLVWVGPSPEAIAAMGSKVAARVQMEAAGVPVLPGRRIDPEGDLERLAEEVGLPLLVKASAGGGGRGMRQVRSLDELGPAVAAARREAHAAFGDDTVFLERLVEHARHVEIQILGDAFGTLRAFHERDCSIQRRHQKVVEEAPSPALDPALRGAMSAAAEAAGAALGYVGAGTVEFLLTPQREFFFLEVNTRLQVEHPVTELITGLDLVELQLRLAQGAPLPEVPPARGHAIEARLYAEDPARDFLPATGTLSRLRIPGTVRVDSGVADGAVVSPFYDPLLAKVIAHGATREEAARRLADALARAEIHGLTTNRDFLVRVLRHPEFRAGGADTAFLDRADLAQLAAPLLDAEALGHAAVAAALALQARRRRDAGVLGALPSGWRNLPSAPQRIELDHGGTPIAVEYRLDRAGGLARLRVDGADRPDAVLYSADPDRVDLAVEGRRRAHTVHISPEAVHVNGPRGQATFRVVARHPAPEIAAAPGSLASPMPGTVLRVLVRLGDAVVAGTPLLVLEAMKMEHEIVAPSDGEVAELPIAEGEHVGDGTVLVRLN
jgi:acetyl/propionyl-CoA carboxylase alpha subunit